MLQVNPWMAWWLFLCVEQQKNEPAREKTHTQRLLLPGVKTLTDPSPCSHMHGAIPDAAQVSPQHMYSIRDRTVHVGTRWGSVSVFLLGQGAV